MTEIVLYCSEEELSEKVWASEFAIRNIGNFTVIATVALHCPTKYTTSNNKFTS